MLYLHVISGQPNEVLFVRKMIRTYIVSNNEHIYGLGFAWYYSEVGGKEVSAKDGQDHQSSRKKQTTHTS